MYLLSFFAPLSPLFPVISLLLSVIKMPHKILENVSSHFSLTSQHHRTVAALWLLGDRRPTQTQTNKHIPRQVRKQELDFHYLNVRQLGASIISCLVSLFWFTSCLCCLYNGYRVDLTQSQRVTK